MSKRMRMTPFARFFIVMLFLAPVAYIGASYYNGEDGIGNIKSWIDQVRHKSAAGSDESETVKALEAAEDKIADLERINSSLKDELKTLQKQLENCK
ncbi:MAG TPA: hypothetical protein PKA00_19180 [Saprospiraceae bacterium]|nr:hypothetical protein [Saprospiraceae bacterium]HMQ85041.1 hypothetical protein [Saprospiraceae bacterium]